MKAHELLSDRERWTRGVGARDFKGNRIGVLDERATCWCLAGSIAKCYPRDEIFPQLNRVREVLLGRNIDVGPVVFNDTHTYEEVIDVLKEADV